MANFLATGCCQTAGYKRFIGMKQGVGKCMKKPCAGCTAVALMYVAVNVYPGMTLHCFSDYTYNAESTKTSYELMLIGECLEFVRSAASFPASETRGGMGQGPPGARAACPDGAGQGSPSVIASTPWICGSRPAHGRPAVPASMGHKSPQPLKT